MNCTGKRCLAQYNKVDPATCTAVPYCPQATPPKTNADRIRSMTDEELAEFLDRWALGDIDYSKTFCDLCKGQYDCHDDCLMDWLKEEVEHET